MVHTIEMSHYLSPERVFDLMPLSKDELFEIMLSMMVQHHAIHDPAAVRKAIFARERESVTAVGHGIAIPHARCACVDDFVVAFARVKDGMEYGNDDGEAVRIVFMIVASDHQDKEYIKLLSRLMLRLRNTEFIAELLNAPNTETMFKLLKSSR